MPRPRKQKHLSNRDRLLIHCFLESHKERALKGVESSTQAMSISPTSKQFQGMAAHFAKMVAVCEDMAAGLGGKQEWIGYFLAACEELEITP